MDRSLEQGEHGLPFDPRKEPGNHRLDLEPSEGDTVKALGQLGRRPGLGAPRHFRDQCLNQLFVRTPRPLDDIPRPRRAAGIVVPRAEVALDGFGDGVSSHGGRILPSGGKNMLQGRVNPSEAGPRGSPDGRE